MKVLWQLKIAKEKISLEINWIKYLYSGKSKPPTNIPSTYKLSKMEFKIISSKFYHDFSIFGFPTKSSQTHYKNQKSKDKIMLPMIDKIIQDFNPSTALELFSADCYFGNYLALNGDVKVDCFDINKRDEGRINFMKFLIGNSHRLKFEIRTAFDIDKIYDVVLCLGGLYHISNPKKLLELLNKKTKKALIIQTIYMPNKKNYFISPNPGTSWGCRFSKDYLLKIIDETGWKVIEEKTNELSGNIIEKDKYSIYLLCVPIQTEDTHSTIVKKFAKRGKR